MLPHLLEPNCEAASSGKPAIRVWGILKGRTYSSEHVTCSQVRCYSQGQICGREGDGWAWLFGKSPVLGWSAHFHWTQTNSCQGAAKVQLDIKLESRLESPHGSADLRSGVDWMRLDRSDSGRRHTRARRICRPTRPNWCHAFDRSFGRDLQLEGLRRASGTSLTPAVPPQARRSGRRASWRS
jgi:hypothetical protein